MSNSCVRLNKFAGLVLNFRVVVFDYWLTLLVRPVLDVKQESFLALPLCSCCASIPYCLCFVIA